MLGADALAILPADSARAAAGTCVEVELLPGAVPGLERTSPTTATSAGPAKPEPA
jgi:hypothetical protein